MRRSSSGTSSPSPSRCAVNRVARAFSQHQLRLASDSLASLGFANIIGMPWTTMQPGAPLATLGVMFNMLLFVLPGLVVAGIGFAIGKRKRGAQTTQAVGFRR